MCRRGWIALAPALLVAASLAPPAHADGACLPPAVTAALADCSGAASLLAMSPADLLRAGSAAPPTAATTPRKAPRGPALAPRPLDAAEAKLAGAYQRFACDDKPAAGDTTARERHMEVAYGRGRLYFGANHFPEAAVVFREIATTGAGTTVGLYAMQLYLESINVLGSQGAGACYDDMTRDVPVFVGLYCTGGRENTNAEACELLDRIQRDIERLAAEKEVRAAEHLPREPAIDLYRAAAERYMEIWRRRGEGRCAAKQPGCARMDEILYNAARAYQAARDVPKAIAVRQILLDPKYHLEDAELARRAPYEIGANYHALADYEQAASWYERFAVASPKAERASDALQDAVVLRLGLGQEDQAVRDGALFNKNYGSSYPARTAAIAFALGAHDVDREDWAEARKKLGAAMSQIDRYATLDLRIQAHALLGRAFLRLDRPASAVTEFNEVRESWNDPAAVTRKIEETSGGDSRRLARALAAKGEAVFFFAEAKRRAAEAIRMPAYTGSGRRGDVADFIAKTLRPVVGARQKAVDEAEKGYLEVLEIQPFAPPQWVVAAAGRVARMRSLLAAELRALPAPTSWKRRGASPWGSTWEEVRASWRDALIDASEPQHRAAHAAHRRCVDLSLKMQWVDEGARRCASWLERNFPAEHPRLDEISPGARFLARGLADRSDPEPDPRSFSVLSASPSP